MIVPGPIIHSAVAEGRIRITPYDQQQINPASYDMRLGRQVTLYCADKQDADDQMLLQRRGIISVPPACMLDSKAENSTVSFDMQDSGFWLSPGTLYLMHTEESVFTERYVPVIDGKSSIGRLGIQVHMTAGFGDPGFNGQFTLEVTVTGNTVKVYPGMRFCQVRFHEMQRSDCQLLYSGQYQGQDARGARPSRSWAQFEREPDRWK